MSQRPLLHRLLYLLDRGVDAGWRVYRKIRRPYRSAQLVPYRWYGTAEVLTVRGRILTNCPIHPSETDSPLQSAWYMLRRWASREVPGARVRAEWEGQGFVGITDEEGYFQIEIPRRTDDQRRPGWLEVELTLPDFIDAPAALARVLVPPAEAQFGVISDIDDTITFSSATHPLRMAKTVLLGTAFTRLPFPGVAALYRGLERGTLGHPANPLFYVSSSPWNLYDVLRDLFEHHGLPAGPLLLQDFGIDATKFLLASHREHKLAAIRDLFERYPTLPFLLLGDSGQADPEIYRELVARYPERVLAIYIRDVSEDPARDAAVQKLAAEIAGARCHLVLAAQAEQMAEDALRCGWITPAVLEEVRAR